MGSYQMDAPTPYSGERIMNIIQKIKDIGKRVTYKPCHHGFKLSDVIASTRESPWVECFICGEAINLGDEQEEG